MNIQQMFIWLDEILEADLDFVKEIVRFISGKPILLLLCVAPILLVSIKVLKRLFKL